MGALVKMWTDHLSAGWLLTIHRCHFGRYRIARSPDAVFVAGDTAQTILEGSDFRFDDIRTVISHAFPDGKAKAEVFAKTKPHVLSRNYRSHAGILNVAANLVDKMAQFFPDSVDSTGARDKGICNGPKPLLVWDQKTVDLALRDPTMIILCRDEEKAEVKRALVEKNSTCVPAIHCFWSLSCSVFALPTTHDDACARVSSKVPSYHCCECRCLILTLHYPRWRCCTASRQNRRAQ